jgi:hypothetical protein
MSWGYVAVGVGTAVAGYLGSESSKDAARSQEKSAQAAIAEQRAAREAHEARLAPFAEPGELALQQQAALTGLGTAEQQEEALSRFTASPGQQFLRDQQERALLRNTAAIGGLGGGNVRSALQAQAFGRAQTDLSNQFNRLASISGTSQTAAQQLGQAGAQYAGNIGQLQMAGGQARASGILGESQARQQTLSQLGGIAAQSGVFNQAQPTAQPQTTQQPITNQQFIA